MVIDSIIERVEQEVTEISFTSCDSSKWKKRPDVVQTALLSSLPRELFGSAAARCWNFVLSPKMTRLQVMAQSFSFCAQSSISPLKFVSRLWSIFAKRYFSVTWNIFFLEKKFKKI